MKKIKSLLFVIFLLSSFATLAQNVKPEFKKFILVSYRPSGQGDKKFIRIENSIVINADGVMRKTYNRFENYYGDLTFKGSMGDTTYRLPDSLITKMNNVFADGKELGEQKELQSQPAGANFAGPFTFLSYIDMAGNIHNTISAGRDEFDQSVIYVMDKLFRLRFARIQQVGKVYRDKNLEALILKHHNSCKNVPEIVEPPSVSSLEIADPGVKH